MQQGAKKICSKCGEEKNLSDFYKYKTRRGLLFSLCKKCESERVKKYGQRYLASMRFLGDSMFDGTLKECSFCHIRYPRTKENWSKVPQNLVDRLASFCKHCGVSRRYGLESVLKKEEIRKFQNNKCLYCGLELPPNGLAVIEHDHRIIPFGPDDPRWKTIPTELKIKSIRGLVHIGCNIRAGHIDEYFNSESLQLAYQSVVKDPPAQHVLTN